MDRLPSDNLDKILDIISKYVQEKNPAFIPVLKEILQIAKARFSDRISDPEIATLLVTFEETISKFEIEWTQDSDSEASDTEDRAEAA